MKLTDVAVGETIVYEDRENHKQATPYKVLATRVPIEWIKDEPDPKHPERRLYTRPHLSPDTVAGLGVTVGLGSGGRPMPVSMKGRNWRDQPRTGVLAMQMGWDDEPVTYEATAIGGRTASFCVLTSGHDFQPYDEFRSWWRSRSDFSLRFADNKDRPGWVAYAYPQPPDEGDGGLAVGSQRNYFGIDEVPLLTVTAADLSPDARWVFDAPFYLLMNLAVGGNWPGRPDASTPDPSTMLVDWVRVVAA